jgi:hypothetical protein
MAPLIVTFGTKLKKKQVSEGSILALLLSPLEEHCHNSKNTTFQKRGKTTGRGDAVTSKEQ